MKIAIVGAGNVGGALGRSWVGCGHQVVFGVRRPGEPKVESLVAGIGPQASAHEVPEACARGEAVVLATPWASTEAAIRQAGGNLRNKPLIDCTNPLKPDLSGLTIGTNDSGGEQVARWASGASVFKAMNTTGFANLTRPAFPGGKPVMFICGDDDARKPVVLDLISQLGFETIDAGGIAISRLLEPYALLWIHLALRRNLGTNFAFALLRR
ncbi:MAG TPA: NADPH-dependent F420 reductase [Candidatus Binataceae bacterium]|nr:NADPH-dependent F420 reductase [Candidatus Binataceae bacterium]